MKKLAFLVSMIVVMSVCNPSFGYILVYKLSSTVKAVDDLVDAKEVIKIKGYLIIDYDDIELDINDADVVLFGKDQDDTLACVRLDYEDDMGINYTVYAVNSWVGFRYGGNRHGIEVILTSLTKTKDIGLDVEKTIPGTLKGSIFVWSQILLDPVRWTNLTGSGTVSAPLHSGLTKEANENSYSSNTIADSIIDELVADGYVEVAPL
jgi:hypothetical protein